MVREVAIVLNISVKGGDYSREDGIYFSTNSIGALCHAPP